MNNPTCPQCLTPLAARDAMPFMGQVAIWLQCECGYETVAIAEASRFNPGFNWQGYEELCQETEIVWQKFLAILNPQSDSAVLDTPEFKQFKRVFDISNAYYEAWQGR